MKNWRYYNFVIPEKAGGNRNRIALFPLPHLLRISFRPAPDNPLGDQAPKGKDELQIVFATETVTVRGTGLRPLVRKLVGQEANLTNDQLIEIPGMVGAEVEVEVSGS